MNKEYIEREALIELIEKNSETKFDWSECVDIDILRPAILDMPTADVVSVDALVEQLAKLEPYIVDGVVMFDLGEWTRWLRDIGAKEGSPLNEHYELGAKIDGGE